MMPLVQLHYLAFRSLTPSESHSDGGFLVFNEVCVVPIYNICQPYSFAAIPGNRKANHAHIPLPQYRLA